MYDKWLQIEYETLKNGEEDVRDDKSHETKVWW